MSDRPSEQMALLRNLAMDLSIEVDEKTLEGCIKPLNRLETAADAMKPSMEERDLVGRSGDDEYNAFLTIYEEPRSKTTGELSDVSVGVKDNIAVQGLTMTCGSSEFSLVPSSDAVVVERLLAAGASIIGKTNMDLFGFGPSGEFSEFDQVINPIAEDRVPGGSSSGSAAAVAAGLVDAALGTDTGGSVRMPAACCGIVGIKPTDRAVPRHGFVDMAPSLDAIGPLANDVDTAARVLDAIAGHDYRDPSSARTNLGPLDERSTVSNGLTIGVVDPFLNAATGEVRDEIHSLIADVDSMSAVDVEHTGLPGNVDRRTIEDAYFLIAMTEFSWVLRQSGMPRGQGTGYSDELRRALHEMKADGVTSQQVAWRVLPSTALDADRDGAAYTVARRKTIEFQRGLDALFEKFDVLLTPTLRCLPPTYGESESIEGVLAMNGNTIPFNLAGTPAVTVPAGFKDGLPVSAQLVGPPFGDHRAVQAAKLIEQLVE